MFISSSGNSKNLYLVSDPTENISINFPLRTMFVNQTHRRRAYNTNCQGLGGGENEMWSKGTVAVIQDK